MYYVLPSVNYTPFSDWSQSPARPCRVTRVWCGYLWNCGNWKVSINLITSRWKLIIKVRWRWRGWNESKLVLRSFSRPSVVYVVATEQRARRVWRRKVHDQTFLIKVAFSHSALHLLSATTTLMATTTTHAILVRYYYDELSGCRSSSTKGPVVAGCCSCWCWHIIVIRSNRRALSSSCAFEKCHYLR